MTNQEIIDNAPDGATHYQVSTSYGLRYLKKQKNTNRWGVYYPHLSVFTLTFIGVNKNNEIKPLK